MNPVNAYSDAEIKMLLHPQALTAHDGKAVGNIVDTKPYKGIGALVMAHSGIYDTDATKTPSMAMKLQTCATTGGSYADVTGAAFTTVAADSGDTVGTPGVEALAVDFRTCKRYIKLYQTLPTATSNVPKIVAGVVLVAPKSAT